MYGDLKLTFINQCLSQYMQESIVVIRAAAKKMKVGITDEGIKSLAYEALERSASLKFKEYLRMVDMGAGRAHPLGGIRAMRVALQHKHAVGNAFQKDKMRKPKKFYSKTVYGRLSWLEGKLMYGFTEEAIANIKNNIQNAGNIS